jgi:hypothetical protein
VRGAASVRGTGKDERMLGSRPTYFAAGTYGTLAATKDEPESRSSGSSTNSARGVKKKKGTLPKQRAL